MSAGIYVLDRCFFQHFASDPFGFLDFTPSLFWMFFGCFAHFLDVFFYTHSGGFSLQEVHWIGLFFFFSDGLIQIGRTLVPSLCARATPSLMCQSYHGALSYYSDVVADPNYTQRVFPFSHYVFFEWKKVPIVLFFVAEIRVWKLWKPLRVVPQEGCLLWIILPVSETSPNVMSQDELQKILSGKRFSSGPCTWQTFSITRLSCILIGLCESCSEFVEHSRWEVEKGYLDFVLLRL